MKRKPPEQINAMEWLNTYADMVTLMLCFFVLLYSISNLDKEKYEVIAEAFANAKPTAAQKASNSSAEAVAADGFALEGGSAANGNSSTPENFDMLYLYMKNFVQDKNMQDKIEIEKDDNYIFIRFKDSLFFNPDSATLRKDGIKILEFLGVGLKNVQSQIQTIRIDGHTAAVATASKYPVSDRVLSSDRANNVLMYFEDTVKIDPKILVATGYGKNRPVADNSTADGRAMNRRVELLIIKKNDGTDNSATTDILQKYFSGQALNINTEFQP